MQEIWKTIAGFEEAYEVSSLGRVRSLDRIAISSSRGAQRLKGRVLRPGRASTGYLTVALRKAGLSLTRTIHELVACAFLGPRPKGQVIDHIDGVRTNNLPANLRYVSQKVNCHNNTAPYSASGRLGVYRNGSGWMAQINVDGRQLHLGTYRTIEEAAAARNAHEGKVNWRGFT